MYAHTQQHTLVEAFVVFLHMMEQVKPQQSLTRARPVLGRNSVCWGLDAIFLFGNFPEWNDVKTNGSLIVWNVLKVCNKRNNYIWDVWNILLALIEQPSDFLFEAGLKGNVCFPVQAVLYLIQVSWRVQPAQGVEVTEISSFDQFNSHLQTMLKTSVTACC